MKRTADVKERLKALEQRLTKQLPKPDPNADALLMQAWCIQSAGNASSAAEALYLAHEFERALLVIESTDETQYQPETPLGSLEARCADLDARYQTLRAEVV